jgi:hypothetical protein
MAEEKLYLKVLVIEQDCGDIADILGVWKIPREPPANLPHTLRCIYEQEGQAGKKLKTNAPKPPLARFCNLGYHGRDEQLLTKNFGPSLGADFVCDGRECIGKSYLFE